MAQKNHTPGAEYADVRESTGLALDDLDVLIAQRAFELYHARGCQNGCDLDDWLEAERKVLSQVPPM